MPSGPRFSIVIPAHNEESRIGPTLRAYLDGFEDSEVIVVLNGCTDATPALVRAGTAGRKNAKVVQLDDAVGKGGAVRVGFLVADAPIVAYVDADGATSPEEMRRLCELLGPGDDAIIGSRWKSGADVHVRQGLPRRVASRCFNVLVRALFGLPYSDTQCGAKVFRRDSLYAAMMTVETANFAFDVDLLFVLDRRGMNVREVPTVWKDVAGSHVPLVPASLKMLASILRLRLQYSFFRTIVPMFDRLFPTNPIALHDGFRILVLNWRDPKHPQAGGAEAYLYEIARRWVAQGHSVEWLTASFPGAARTELLDGIKITRVGDRFSVYFRVPLEYLRSCRDRFDVILDAENGVPFFSPLYSLKPKLCLIFHVHVDVFRKHLPWPVSEVFVWLETWLVPRLYRGAKFVAISEDTRRAMREARLTDRPVGMVYSGVDSALVPGTRAEIPTVLYLGRLMPYKRVDLLIAAFAEVRERVPDAVLCIAGSGPAEAGLRELVRSLRLDEAVTFEGFVDERRKRELLQSAWAFCNPSEMEGWGISIIEANACATPAVAFAVPGLREAILDGESGMLVPEGGELAKPIVRLLTDAPWRLRLEEGAKKRASAFSWDRTADAMLEQVVQVVTGDWFGLERTTKRWSLMKKRSVNGQSERGSPVTESIPIDVIY